jgi:protease IV
MSVRIASVLCLALSLASSGCIFYAPVDLGALGGAGEFEETVVLGESGPKIAMIDITGVISEEQQRNLGFAERPSVLVETRNALDRAGDDPEVAALLLRINTPGGSVSASDTLHHEVTEWKKRTGRPVAAFLNGLATSGGYYVAMSADHITATPSAVTGSIGVVMPGINVAGLMEKYGVEDQTLKSGPFKDTGSMLRDMRPEEKAQLQSVISDLQTRFVDVVAAGRPELARDRVVALADGRVYSATQAKADGLIDGLGYLEDAVDALEASANLTESRVVAYHRSNRRKENIYSRAPNLAVQINEVKLFPIRQSDLAPGFYYLWPAALAP